MPHHHHQRKCIFCAVGPEGFRLEHLSDQYAVFHDINPSAVFHLQVIPRQHLRDINALDASHIPMLRQFGALAQEIIQRDHFVQVTGPNPQILIGFHVPPFTSVHHLHMHVLVLPIRLRRMYKYSGIAGWFITLEDTIKRLESVAPPPSTIQGASANDDDDAMQVD
ncbi:HIT-like domain-containing protein [Blastocladiella britannica]|nr:HIT-like domain-containing protein [Blastocladiella britannica]